MKGNLVSKKDLIMLTSDLVKLPWRRRKARKKKKEIERKKVSQCSNESRPGGQQAILLLDFECNLA